MFDLDADSVANDQALAADRVLVLAEGEAVFWDRPQELRRDIARDGAAASGGDFEAAFVAFLRERGH